MTTTFDALNDAYGRLNDQIENVNHAVLRWASNPADGDLRLAVRDALDEADRAASHYDTSAAEYANRNGEG